MERFSFKSVCVLWMAEHSKRLVNSVAEAIVALKNFVPLVKDFIASVLKCKAHLNTKFTVMRMRYNMFLSDKFLLK